MALPKTLQKLLTDPRVDDISDERNDDAGYWIYFKPGWISSTNEIHCVHEYTVRDVMREIKNMVPCNCEWNCKGAKS